MPGKDDGQNRNKSLMFTRILMVFFFLTFFYFIVNRSRPGNEAVSFTVSDLYAAIEQDLVKELSINRDSRIVSGVLKDDKRFMAAVVSIEEVEKLAVAKKIKLEVVESSALLNILLGLLPWILIILVMYFFFFRGQRNMNIPGMTFTKSKLEFIDPSKIDVTLDDVAGCDEVKEELKDVLDFLKNPKKYHEFGIAPPRGMLLIGPPGVGKTMLAKAMAKTVNVPFGYLAGDGFVEMFVGVGAARVRDMFVQVFEKAASSGACILFIDEIDALGKRRAVSGVSSGHDEREQALNALLAEMDGFHDRSGIIIIGATNRPEVLDEALKRPGRFDRQVIISPPDIKGREEILKVHSRKLKLASDVDLMEIARGTTGFSGAQLANVIKEAAILTVRHDRQEISRDDLREALDKEFMGPERRLILGPKEKEMTAYHEAGHTLAVIYTKDAEPLYKVTIRPRGLSLGATFMLPDDDRHSYTYDQLFAHLVVAMGGRAAEMLKFNQETTGAQSDFARATKIAMAMVCDYGMSEEVGKAVYPRNERFMGDQVLDCSPATRMIIDQEVKRLLDDAYESAQCILEERKDELEALAKVLMEKEKLDAVEIKDILAKCQPR